MHTYTAKGFSGVISLSLCVLTGDSSADHAISNSIMRLIWSFGQVYPDYFHSPNSGIEAETVTNTRFYQPDEIKYHGSRNRGAASVNFFGKPHTHPFIVSIYSKKHMLRGKEVVYVLPHYPWSTLLLFFLWRVNVGELLLVTHSTFMVPTRPYINFGNS